MSRFLFTTFGSLGDLHPYVAVARALRERGHEAVIAASNEYRDAVTGAGVEFATVRPSMDELGDYQTMVTRVLDPRRGPEFLIRTLVMPHLRLAYEDQLRASEGADLLVSHPLAFTLPLVAAKRKLPWVATVLSPVSLMSCYDPPVIGSAPWLRTLRIFGPTPYRLLFGLVKRMGKSWEAPLHDLRAELGLPPLKKMAMFEGQFSPLRNLALFDAPLAPPQPDWPPLIRVCGTPLFDGGAADSAMLSDLDRFLDSGEAPVVFALGSSAVWVAGDFWQNAVEAVVKLKRRALLITGPKVLESLPEGVKAFPYLPYSVVFPRAAAVVHQSGIGTLSQANRSGRPQLLVPVAFDQPDNSDRARRLGVGRVVPFRKTSARVLARELGVLLSNPEYARAARTLADELRKTNGADKAADELITSVRSPAVAA